MPCRGGGTCGGLKAGRGVEPDPPADGTAPPFIGGRLGIVPPDVPLEL